MGITVDDSADGGRIFWSNDMDYRKSFATTFLNAHAQRTRTTLTPHPLFFIF